MRGIRAPFQPETRPTEQFGEVLAWHDRCAIYNKSVSHGVSFMAGSQSADPVGTQLSALL